MKLMFELTVQHLIQNKRKTFVTLMATTLSVTMLTAIIVAATSGYAFLKEDTIYAYGNYHVLYYDLPVKNIELLMQDEQTESLSLGYPVGFAKTDSSTKESSPDLYIEALDFTTQKHRPIDLKEGRLPQNTNEIIVSEEYLNSLSQEMKLGDTLEVSLGDRILKTEAGEINLGQSDDYFENEETFVASKVQQYTIVGIMQQPAVEGFHFAYAYYGFTLADEQVMSSAKTVDAAVLMKDGRAYYDVVPNLAPLLESRVVDDWVRVESPYRYNIDINSPLIGFEGDIYDSTLMAICQMAACLIVIVIALSIQIIHNSFELSLASRRKYLGILSSIGVTKHQKKQAVMIEAVIVGIISIPMGFILGISGLHFAFSIVTNIMSELTVFDFEIPLTVTIVPSTILLVMVLTGLIIYFSALSPAKKAGRISAIECIKQLPEYTNTTKEVKVSPLMTRLFGIEGELALKTIKRQKRQYYTTVTNLVFILVTFLVIGHTISLAQEVLHSITKEQTYDVMIQDCDDQTINEVVNLSSTETYQLQQYVGNISYYGTPLPEQMNNEELYIASLGDYIPITLELDVIALDDETFKSYLSKLGEPTDDLDVFVLYNQYVSGGRLGNYTYEKLFDEEENIIINDDISFYTEGKGNVLSREIALPIHIFATELPSGINKIKPNDSIPIFTSFSHLKQLKNTDDVWDAILNERQVTLTVSSKDPLAIHERYDGIKDNILYFDGYVNYGAYENQADKIQTIIEIFLFGFVLLILSLTLLSIFNNIVNNMLFRRKEFSTLISIGMTESSVQKMVVLESVMYVFKALVYGLPIAFGLMFVMTSVIRNFYLIPYTTLPYSGILMLVVILSGFTIMISWYSIRQLKGFNLIESLRNENI